MAEISGPKGYWATAPMECWSCSNVTRITGLLACPPIKCLEEAGEVDVSDIDDPMFLTEVIGLTPELERQAAEINPGLRYDFSQTAGAKYLMNHCQHCGAKIGDYYIFKAEGPLLPYYEPARLEKIELTPIASAMSGIDAGEVSSSFIQEILDAREPK